MQDSAGLWILGTGFQYLSVKFGFRIQIVSGIRDSLNCISDSKAQDSGLHELKFPANRPFAASHSRGTKPPYWRAKVGPGQDKQRKLPFKIMYVFCLSCPSATFALQHGGFVPRDCLAAKGLLGFTKRFLKRLVLTYSSCGSWSRNNSFL